MNAPLKSKSEMSLKQPSGWFFFYVRANRGGAFLSPAGNFVNGLL